MEHIYAGEVIPTVAIENVFSPAKNFTTLGSFVNVILKNAFTIAGVILLVLLIFGGFTFIVSAGGGDAKKAEQAKHTITAALTGFILVFASYWIIQIIQIITGVPILNLK